MRLLSSTDFELVEFVGDKVPPYAILSHTWSSEEVTLNDIQLRHFQHLKGFSKLKGCCAQAARDDIQWVWIDTCCIDKSSSAELSEAINSMYRWYRNADVCYVHLYDVPPLDPFLNKHSFQNARWFTRGWCLQELIAPRDVEFYAENWTELGTKWSLQESISEITSIPRSVLLQKKQPRRFSVAERLSWASKRNTTRSEDMAYCLLGLFGIHMPLLYGEGSRAFMRLQDEIMKREVDYSLFLWISTTFHDAAGMLCDSPHCFPTDGVPSQAGEFCKYSDLLPLERPDTSNPQSPVAPEITPRGLRMSLYVNKPSGDGSWLAWLNMTHRGRLVCLRLMKMGDEVYRARTGYVEVLGNEDDLAAFHLESLCMEPFSDLSIPSIPMQILDFKLYLKSIKKERLAMLDVYPECSFEEREDGSLGTELHIAACPEFFTFVLGVENGPAVHQFVVAVSLFHGSWACRIRNYKPGIPLKTLSDEIWGLKSNQEESDRAISRIPGNSYVILAAKRRTRSNQSSLHVSLIPAPGGFDGEVQLQGRAVE